jgi:outer membrane murein-binding lipoprotein Lpp
MLKALLLLALILPQPAVAADTWWDKVKSYSVEKKNEAMTYGRQLVRDTDRQIRSLERRAAKASGEAKDQLDSDIRELKTKRAAASNKLDEMGKATGAAWDEAKDGFADAYKDLQDAYERARKKLK